MHRGSGAWDTGPLDSDTALDWYEKIVCGSLATSEIEKKIIKVISDWEAWKTKKLRVNTQGKQELRRAAAELIITESPSGATFQKSTISHAIASLTELAQDKKWLRDWHEKKDDVLEDIERQIQELRMVMTWGSPHPTVPASIPAAADETAERSAALVHADEALRQEDWGKVTF